MKSILAASVLLVFGIALVHGQTGSSTTELSNVIPAAVRVEQFTLTSDEQRTYYTTPSGEVWLYDRTSKSTTRITADSVWDLSVSPLRDALVYTKSGDTRQEEYVWLLPLDPRTGLASGNARRLSAHSGDIPSISPDGKSVAFARDDSSGVGQSVVVVPISGGEERAVATALPSSIGNIRWTPDGKTIYFGVNPPVPFTCAESCLSVPGGNPQVPGSIRRVAVAGGSVEVVATTGNPSPGLTPDGTKLVFADIAGNRQFVVADTTGKRLNTFTLSPTQIQQGWSGNASLVLLTSGTIRRLRAVSPADGRLRTLFETDGFMLGPAWSPDSKMVSGLRADGDHCQLRIMNVEGVLQKEIALPGACGESPAWTPDQRRIVYTRYFPPDRHTVITAVDIATGQTKELRQSPATSDMRWVMDSNGVIVSELSEASGPQRRVSFWQVDFDGKATLLRELPFDEPAGSFAAPLDRSTAMVMRTPRDLRLIRLDGSAADRVVSPAQNGYVFPRPSISADKEWAAFRINPSGNDTARMNRIELVRLDGTARRTVDLPFFAQPQDTLVIMPGAKQLVMVERPSPGVDTGVYLVDVETSSVKKLFGYVPQGRFPEIVASPDGRTLLALINEALNPTVSAMDFSNIR